MARRHNQKEGIDFYETFAPVTLLEAICILLALTSSMNIKLYQMDVKYAFQNGYLHEKVYVERPLIFENPDFFNHI